ncbi:hypothetical protein [Pseudomonas sp. JQ36]
MSNSKDARTSAVGILAAYIPEDVSFSTDKLIISIHEETLALEGIYLRPEQPNFSRNVRVFLTKDDQKYPRNGWHKFPAENIRVEYDGNFNADFFRTIPGEGVIFLNLDPATHCYSYAMDISFTKEGSNESFHVICSSTMIHQ